MTMNRARWSNGCSYAVEFDFDFNNQELSLSNALKALEEFETKVEKHAYGNHQYSVIAYLHVQWGKTNWGNPLRIKKLETEGAFKGASFSEPVNVRIIPGIYGYSFDEALCINQWGKVFPLMVNVLKWDKSLENLIVNVSDDIKLQCDLTDWDGELKNKLGDV